MNFCVQLYYNTGTKIKNRDAVNKGITKAKHKDGRIKDEYTYVHWNRRQPKLSGDEEKHNK